MSEAANPKRGWGKSPVSRKWHYFAEDSFSLCRKIGFYLGPTEDEYDDHPENCAECRRKRLRQREKNRELATAADRAAD